MLFRDDIEPMCQYCSRSEDIGSGRVVCLRRGVLSAFSSCDKFDYDPIKRIPERHRPAEFPEYSDEDFTI